LRNPLRWQADASWWFAMVAVGAVLVCVLTVLSPAIGVIWAAMLLGFGAGFALRNSSQSRLRHVQLARSEDGRHRVLVLANQELGNPSLLTEIRSRCEGRRGEVLIVAPALTASRTARWTSDVDEAIEDARRRLRLSLRAAEEAGLAASGQVGDPDPNIALEDALRTFAADEIVIWTHTPDRSPWLEHGVVQRAREEVDLPVTHVVLDPAAESGGQAQATSQP
jgi:hypothetical protein